jgi:hypothetical protein
MGDWRNPAEYGYLLENDMTPERWAWEFSTCAGILHIS